MDDMKSGWFARLGQVQPAICGWLVVLWLLPVLAGLALAPSAAANAAETGQIHCSHHTGSLSQENGKPRGDRCPCCVLCGAGCATCNPVIHSPDEFAAASWFDQQPVTVLIATAACVTNTIRIDDKPPRGPPVALAI
jgi:hypothetical protein